MKRQLIIKPSPFTNTISLEPNDYLEEYYYSQSTIDDKSLTPRKNVHHIVTIDILKDMISYFFNKSVNNIISIDKAIYIARLLEAGLKVQKQLIDLTDFEIVMKSVGDLNVTSTTFKLTSKFNQDDLSKTFKDLCSEIKAQIDNISDKASNSNKTGNSISNSRDTLFGEKKPLLAEEVNDENVLNASGWCCRCTIN